MSYLHITEYVAYFIKMPKRKSGSLLHVKIPKSEPLFLFAIFSLKWAVRMNEIQRSWCNKGHGERVLPVQHLGLCTLWFMIMVYDNPV